MKNHARRLAEWSPAQIAAQWDRLAPIRDAQLRAGRDLSFESVLKPAVLNLLPRVSCESVLDAGCGSGVLTEFIADHANRVVGVDMSAANIELAVRSATRRPNVDYVSNTIEDFSKKTTDRFSLVVANMVLQDSYDLDGCLSAIAELSAPGAALISTITHPWFWPVYWAYEKEPWFHYQNELAIEAPFAVSSDGAAMGVTTHFHRPLSSYLAALGQNGFRIEELIEPMPSPEVQEKYPQVWEFPRFLVFRAEYSPSR